MPILLRKAQEGADTIFVFSAFSIFFLLKIAASIQAGSGGYEPTSILFWCIVFSILSISFSLPQKYNLHLAGLCTLFSVCCLVLCTSWIHSFPILNPLSDFQFLPDLCFFSCAAGLLFVCANVFRASERLLAFLPGMGTGAWFYLLPSCHLVFLLAALCLTFLLLFFRSKAKKECRPALTLQLFACTLCLLDTDKLPNLDKLSAPRSLHELVLTSAVQSENTSPAFIMFQENGIPVPMNVFLKNQGTEDSPIIVRATDKTNVFFYNFAPAKRPQIIAFRWEHPANYRFYHLFSPDKLKKVKRTVLAENGIFAAALPSDEKLAASAIASAKLQFANVRLIRWHGLFLLASDGPLAKTPEELCAMAEKKENESRLLSRLGAPEDLLTNVLPPFQDTDRDDLLFERAKYAAPVSVHSVFTPPDLNSTPSKWFQAFRAGAAGSGWFFIICALCYLTLRYWRSGIPGGRESFFAYEGGFLCGGTGLYVLLWQTIGDGVPITCAAADIIRFAAVFVFALLLFFPKQITAPPFLLRILCMIAFLLTFGNIFPYTLLLFATLPILCSVRFVKDAVNDAASFCSGISCALFLCGLCFFSTWYMLPILFLMVLAVKRVRNGNSLPAALV